MSRLKMGWGCKYESIVMRTSCLQSGNEIAVAPAFGLRPLIGSMD